MNHQSEHTQKKQRAVSLGRNFLLVEGLQGVFTNLL
jgi:hypothetical protein